MKSLYPLTTFFETIQVGKFIKSHLRVCVSVRGCAYVPEKNESRHEGTISIFNTLT